MDGILCDSEKFYMDGTVDQMLSYGYKGDLKEIYPIIGTTMAETYARLYHLLDGKVPLDVIQKNNEIYFLVEHPVPYGKIMFPDVPACLEAFTDMGIKMAVCSSSSRELIEQSLEDMHIAQYFHYVISSDEVKKAKPAPDVYLQAWKELGVEKACSIVYEDSTMGIAAGKAAGIFTCARRDDRYGQDQSGADKIVDTMSELLSWIREVNANAGSHED